jgi:hypothetical protein
MTANFSERTLSFTFSLISWNTSTRRAVKAISEWKKEVGSLHPPDTKVDLIYNCISMTDFDTAARKKWQENHEGATATYECDLDSFR